MAEVTNPTKLTDDVVKKLEEAFAMDCTVEEACLMANISKQTYYNWINSFPEWKERFDELKNHPFLKARKTIVDSLDKPEYAYRYMERKKKKEFGQNVDITTDGKELTVNVINYANNTPDQLSTEKLPETTTASD